MRRPRAKDHGIATIEYAALLLVLAAVVGGMFAADLPSRAASGGVSAVCKIFSSGDCSRKKDSVADGSHGGANECKAFCPTANNPIHPSDPVTAATKGGYVALGDSYSSGEGAAEQYLDNSGQTGCHRAAGAYSQDLGQDYTFQDGTSFVACSGATTDGIINGWHGEGSQLDALNPRTTLVTLSAGGNDAHFADVMSKCVLDAHFSPGDLWPGHKPHPDRCAAQAGDIQNSMNDLFGGEPSKYQQFLEQVHQRAPNARIIVVGYPHLFPSPPSDNYATITKGDQEFLNGIEEQLNNHIRDTVNKVDNEFYGNGQQKMGSVEFADNTDGLKGHEITTKDPWINGIDICAGLGIPTSNQNCQSGKVLPSVGTGTFHPTAEGQKAFEEAVRRQLENGPNRTIYDP